MRAFIVSRILDAPETRDAFGVKRNVIRAAHFTKGRFRKTDFAIARERIEDIGKLFTRLVVPHQADREDFSCARVVDKDSGDFAEFIFVFLDVLA